MSLLPWFEDSPLYRPRYQVSTWRDPEDYLTRSLLRYPLEEIRNLSSLLQDTGVSVSSDKDKFQANVDVAQFKPEEISVKITGDNVVTVEGKHEEKEDEHGYISRHFVRRYVLPENCNIKEVKSKLSSDGVLTITAPKVSEEKAIEHREIPITKTGQPVKRVEQKPSEESKK
ncbi:alpha-crystallin A chain-like [Anoplophora glabripennis]|uniref:alpha-crystallin A chain-like n=1 Tax=Anoplophora glabripennis TaxID=217634 RepID=UPI000874A732|nr:alpha-crystallin A chain-like [Anoplophora glabripennis]